MSSERIRHIVITDQSHGLPYSKGLMASSLMMSGLPAGDAFRIAERIEERLKEQGIWEISSRELRELAASLLADFGEQFAISYLKWQTVEELDVPLVILLGGATGVGKSTVATQLAARLGITRVVSTDAIREVMRSGFSVDLMPTLHESSFTADAALRAPLPKSADRLLFAFQEQVAAVSVGVKALIARAIEEGTDIIVEGAHVVPGFLEGWEEDFNSAVILPIVIGVSDTSLHRSHFHMRMLETRSSRHSHYLESFDKIRKIQDYISQLANENSVPMVQAYDLDTTLQEIISLVIDKVLSRSKGSKDEESTVARAFEVTEKGEVVRKHKLNRVKGWEALAGRRKSP